VIGPDKRIAAFEVLASLADSLDVTEALRQADQFDFAEGRDIDSDQVYFSAQSKDKKILVRFEVQVHNSVLSSAASATDKRARAATTCLWQPPPGATREMPSAAFHAAFAAIPNHSLAGPRR